MHRVKSRKMKNSIYKTAMLLALSFTTCTYLTRATAQTENSSNNQNSNYMKSFVSIFEIPATDISRAVSFYEEILGLSIERMDFPEMEMGIFPYEEQVVTGIIVKGEGYRPSADGVTLYLNGGEDLQIILDQVEKSGGKIIIPKTAHADESGFFAIFLDSEGNKMGLHSPN